MKLEEINQGELDPITDALLDHAVVAMRSAADRGDAETIAKGHESMINIARLRKLLPAVQQGGKTKEIADRLGITQTNLCSLLYSIGMSLKDIRKNQSLVELISDSQKMNRHLLELELCYIEAKQEHFFSALTQALQKVRERTRQRLEQPTEEKGEESENPDIYW